MYLLTKTYSRYNFLLFLSSLLVALAFYGVIKNPKFITMSPVASIPKQVKERTISIVMTPAPIVKKQIKKIKKSKPIKKIVKKKPIPKPIKKKIIQKTKAVKPIPIKKPIKKIEPIQEIKPIQTTELIYKQVINKPIINKKIVKQEVKQKSLPVTPVFNAQKKASFIAGLYELLNEKKYYPKMAKRRKLEGITQISFTLNKDGSVKDVFLHQSSGHKILDKASLKVVRAIGSYKPIPDTVSMASLHLNIPIKYSRN